VIDRGHLNTAGGYAKGRVLDSLEFLDMGWRGVVEPNESWCVGRKGLSNLINVGVGTGNSEVISMKLVKKLSD